MATVTRLRVIVDDTLVHECGMISGRPVHSPCGLRGRRLGLGQLGPNIARRGNGLTVGIANACHGARRSKCQGARFLGTMPQAQHTPIVYVIPYHLVQKRHYIQMVAQSLRGRIRSDPQRVRIARKARHYRFSTGWHRFVSAVVHASKWPALPLDSSSRVTQLMTT